MKRILALFLVFILYLVGSEVVAYGALNEDAKKVDERVAIEDRGLHGASRIYFLPFPHFSDCTSTP